VLIVRWCDIIVRNAGAPTEDKHGDLRESFREVLEQVFDYFHPYDINTMLGYFSAKLKREVIFKLTIGNESIHQGSNDRVVNCTT
jgi:hypothetical protein